jgi:hypothetical protein
MAKINKPVRRKAPAHGYFIQRDVGRWHCIGSPSAILNAIAKGGVPVRKGVKTYLKNLAKIGVTRDCFSYEFIPNENMKEYLKTLFTECVDTGGRR